MRIIRESIVEFPVDGPRSGTFISNFHDASRRSAKSLIPRKLSKLFHKGLESTWKRLKKRERGKRYKFRRGWLVKGRKLDVARRSILCFDRARTSRFNPLSTGIRRQLSTKLRRNVARDGNTVFNTRTTRPVKMTGFGTFCVGSCRKRAAAFRKITGRELI